MDMNAAWRRPLAEAVGTFCLVFAGTGAIVIDTLTEGTVTHVGVGLVFGLVVMAMIYSIGALSGAHLNPAVTLGFFAARRLPARDVFPYIFAQSAGAIIASLLLLFLFPGQPGYGQTVPAGPWHQTFVLEIALTAILMFVILRVATGSKEQGLMAGIAIGGTVGLEAIFAGPITGASMNPARSLGPALVANDLAFLWIYLVAPAIGSLIAVVIWLAIKDPETVRHQNVPSEWIDPG